MLVTTAGGALHSARPPTGASVRLVADLVVNIDPTSSIPVRIPRPITHPSCRLHDMGPHHPECPERLDAIAGSADRQRARCATRASSRARGDARAARARVHAAHYIDEIEAASPEEGIRYLDPDTALNPRFADRRAARGRRSGARAPIWSSAASATRHFARCVRPGITPSARSRDGLLPVQQRRGRRRARARRTASHAPRCVDFDVHHGNGTEDIFAGDERVIMTGTFQYPLYPYSGVEPLGPNMHNVPLAPAAAATLFARPSPTSACRRSRRIGRRSFSFRPVSTRTAKTRSPTSS